jgi:hypothetical protein
MELVSGTGQNPAYDQFPCQYSTSTSYSTEGKLKVHFGMSQFFRSKPWKGS